MILARYAEFTGDGLVNVIGGDNDKLVAEEYPYVHPILLAAVRIVLNRTDCAVEHDFRSVIVDAETDEVIAEGVSSTLPPLVMPADANFVGTGLILPFRAVIFPHPGVYVAQVLVDGAVVARARFRVAPMAYYQGLVRPAQAEPQREAANA